MISTNRRLSLWPISNWRIGFKLTISFLLLTLVPVALIAFFVNVYSRDSLLSQGATSLQSAGRSTVRQLESELSEQREYVTIVGQMPEVIRFAQNQTDTTAVDSALRVLRVAVNKSPDYESIAIVSPQGKVILSSAATDIGTDLQFRPYFQEAMKGASYISDPSVSVITNRPAVFYSAPIKNSSGGVVGVIRSRLTLDGIWGLVEQDAGVAGSGSFGMLLDENGIRLADSSSKDNRQPVQDNLLFRAIAPLPAQVEKDLVAEQRFGKASAAGVQVVPLPEISTRLASADRTVFTTRSDVNNTPNQAAIIDLTIKPWHYLISAPQATFTAPADSVTIFATVTAVLLGIIAVVLALLASSSITVPLSQLAQVADRISLGEMDAKIDVRSKDEIGDLAEALIRMQSSLRAAIERFRAQRTNI
jgi:C4-dicarboxylate-specific signal transduction histidine kinase